MSYIQKDLGYLRKKTNAFYYIEMWDGSVWRVPLQVIVDARDEYFKKDKEDTAAWLRKGVLDRFDVVEWASNSMDWKDVEEYAEKIIDQNNLDYQDSWVNGLKEIVGKI